MAGQADRRHPRRLPRPPGGRALPHGQALARGRAARSSATSRSTSPRRSRTPPACCRSRCAARRSSRTQADSRFGSYLCSILKTSLELALDRAACSSTCSSPTRSATRRATWPASGGATSPIPCRDPLPAAERRTRRTPPTYLRGEYDRLRRAHRGGRRPRRHATTTCARSHRRVQREPRAAARGSTPSSARRRGCSRSTRPTCWSRSGGLIPREEHNALLAARAAADRGARRARAQDRIRVVFEGGFCEQPPLDLLRAHRPLLLRGGRRPADRPALDRRADVPRDGDPLAALAEAYLERSSLQPGAARPAQAQGADAARADAAAPAPRPRSSPPPRCASPGSRSRWPTPRARRGRHPVLRERVRGEHDRASTSSQIQLETFVENLLFD